MKEAVYKATKIKSHEYDIDLVCNWPTDSGSKAIKIVDDDDVELMFSAVTKSIELYVGKTRRLVVEEPIQTHGATYGVDDYSRMLGNMSTSHGIASPSFSNPPSNVGQYGQQPLWYAYPPFMNSQSTVQLSYPYPTQDTFARMSER